MELPDKIPRPIAGKDKVLIGATRTLICRMTCPDYGKDCGAADNNVADCIENGTIEEQVMS